MQEKNRIKVVTCIYSGLFGTPLGGSRKHKMIFVYSLKSIAKTGADIVCYTSAKEYEEYQMYFRDTPNISLKVEELVDFKYHSLISRLKRETGVTEEGRCFELVHNKVFFMRKECEYLQSTDHIFWIDAGLSYRDLFPHGTFRVPEWRADFTPENYDNLLFTPLFFQNLVSRVQDSLYFIDMRGNEEPIFNHIIGGMFGGTVERWKTFADIYEKHLVRSLNERRVLLEEPLFTEILNNTDLKLSIDQFTGWYHEDSYIPNLIVTKTPFYHIIRKYA